MKGNYEKNENTFIPLRVPNELKETIDKVSKENLRSRNSEIIYRLSRAYNDLMEKKDKYE